MNHQIKVVIGANYGDEGKGLISRYFTKNFKEAGHNSVTVFHNGSAQRGHTVDYEDGTRHVFHNFAAGTKDGGKTYYADTFLVHPMDFCREVRELGFVPEVSCSPNCLVVTPFDILADHIIEDHIAVLKGVREYGSCGYGTWSATDRAKERPDLAFTVYAICAQDYWKVMGMLKEWVISRLKKFGVELDRVPNWKHFFEPNDPAYMRMCNNFREDFMFFVRAVSFCGFDNIWHENKAIIFEGAQGLMLDKNLNSDWTTTSNTGLRNPSILLSEYSDFDAEVCYVTRSYLTRHGDGPLSHEADKDSVGDISEDMTNQTNPFQGNLRYAPLNASRLEERIGTDFMYGGSNNYYLTTAITHCNEVDCSGGDYRSYSPSKVEKT